MNQAQLQTWSCKATLWLLTTLEYTPNLAWSQFVQHTDVDALYWWYCVFQYPCISDMKLKFFHVLSCCTTVPCRQQIADAVKAQYSQEQTDLQLLLGWRSFPDCSFCSYI